MAINVRRSSGGVVVKLLACGARGPGFNSRSRRYDFRDWLSPASKSQYGWKVAKATKILKTTNQPTLTYVVVYFSELILVMQRNVNVHFYPLTGYYFNVKGWVSEWICCLTSQLTIFQSYMWRHIDVQADWRRSWTYGRAPNAIDIS